MSSRSCDRTTTPGVIEQWVSASAARQGRGLPEKLHSAGVVLPKRYTGAGRSHPVARRGKRVQKRRAGLALLGSMCMAGGVSHALSAEADAPGLPGNSATAQELPRWWSLQRAAAGLRPALNQVPSNVQTADSQDMKRAQTTDVADYLKQKLQRVNVNESADNPFQLDINYHGFTASPLLGTPEGLSVYLDGVRVNESFGDTVNWDLIPESAISTASLISGSNPVFGLNTLAERCRCKPRADTIIPERRLKPMALLWSSLVPGESGGRSGLRLLATLHYFDESGWREPVTNNRLADFRQGGGRTTRPTSI